MRAYGKIQGLSLFENITRKILFLSRSGTMRPILIIIPNFERYFFFLFKLYQTLETKVRPMNINTGC